MYRSKWVKIVLNAVTVISNKHTWNHVHLWLKGNFKLLLGSSCTNFCGLQLWATTYAEYEERFHYRILSWGMLRSVVGWNVPSFGGANSTSLQGRDAQNPGRHVSHATKFCMAAPNACGPFNMLLAPRTFRWPLDFWKAMHPCFR
jgi:hypothetical protein